jgi:hypothetical protein
VVFFAKYNSNDKVKVSEMGGVCSMHGERRNAFRVLVGKLEGKRPPGRSECRWKDNIKMHLREIEWGI